MLSVDLACTPSALTVNVSTSRMFRGTFGILRSDKPDCRMTVDNEQRFQLTLSYADCDVKKEVPYLVNMTRESSTGAFAFRSPVSTQPLCH